MVLFSLVLAEDWLPHLLFDAEVRFFWPHISKKKIELNSSQFFENISSNV